MRYLSVVRHDVRLPVHGVDILEDSQRVILSRETGILCGSDVAAGVDQSNGAAQAMDI
jgi:hypothetical protein